MELQRLLRDERDEVLTRFVDRVRGLYPQSRDQKGQLLNALPSFLDAVIVSFDDGEGRATGIRESAGIGSDHGEQRFDLDMNIVDMAREWTILRDVILEILLERQTVVNVDEYRRLSQQISAASVASIRRYVELNERERRKLAADHASFVVHDLRNQMQCARTALELHSREVASSEALELLSESLVGLSRVMDRELSVARLDALGSGLDLAMRAVAVDDVIAAAVHETELAAKLRGVRIDVAIEHGLTVAGDARLLHAAFANLISNAVKYTHAGSQIRVAAHRGVDDIVVEVADSCGGLPPNMSATMFDAHATGDDERSGYGIGLAIAHRAVAVHAGTVSVEDRPGHGCLFRVRLPTVKPE